MTNVEKRGIIVNILLAHEEELSDGYAYYVVGKELRTTQDEVKDKLYEIAEEILREIIE